VTKPPIVATITPESVIDQIAEWPLSSITGRATVQITSGYNGKKPSVDWACVSPWPAQHWTT